MLEQLEQIILEPDNLWNKVIGQTEFALNCGALHSIPTDTEFVKEGEINFLVRVLTNLDRKEKAKQEQEKQVKQTGKNFNPFLPYEQDLFVTDISKTHLCLLNKYNVVPYHLLIITREFEDQESSLNLNDIGALWACLLQIDGLIFYNSGQVAGASQPHKHLQLVPLPFADEGERIPIEPFLKKAQFEGEIGEIPSFSFSHAFTYLDINHNSDFTEIIHTILRKYESLLDKIGLLRTEQKPSGAYNLLITRQWMMVIKRSQASFESISVNSLGFAGAFIGT
ncbi:ATP adenylyltransferase family protein [Aphanothece sacrum]|uniref:Phosphorylase n=1 Tax=Aphanothece sacrum FPU1 TaxID=1920663 RepID=A0A401IJN9_APHSA|nr:phosphorylase [Aphanothece sacrum FPU1]